MTIYGISGKLGDGKTLLAVVNCYNAYLDRCEIFSNIWLDFPHNPVKTPLDILGVREGVLLGDEWWTLADSRKSHTKLNEATIILALRSRKRHFDVYYTQQYILQIDRRIRYYTDYWIKPEVFPKSETRLPPEILIQHSWDGYFNRLPDQDFLNIKEYISLYDTNQDAYTMRYAFSDESIRKALESVYDKEPILKEELEKAKQNALEIPKELI